MDETNPEQLPQEFAEVTKRPMIINKKMLIIAGIAVAILIGLIFVTTMNAKRGKEEKEPTSKDTAKNVKVTSGGLESLFSELFQETELKINDRNTINHLGCKVDGTYEGILKNNLGYIKQENNYQDEASRQNCQNQSITTINVETYLTGDTLIFRNAENQNFKITDTSTRLVTGTYPLDYLKQLFENVIVTEVSDVKEFEDYIQLNAKVETREFAGELVVNIDKANLKITDIDYTLKSPDTETSGLISLNYDNIEINLVEPAGTPELLISVFKDISEHEKATYEYNFEDGTEKMETLLDPPQISATQKNTKNRQCLLSEQQCAEKYEQIKSQFASLESFLEATKEAFCKAEEEASLENSYMFAIKNKGRNPQNPSDHSINIKFTYPKTDKEEEPQKETSYTITLNSGKQYCFTGMTTIDELNLHIGALDLIINDIPILSL